jgi:hypothetical protein
MKHEGLAEMRRQRLALEGFQKVLRRSSVTLVKGWALPNKAKLPKAE